MQQRIISLFIDINLHPVSRCLSTLTRPPLTERYQTRMKNAVKMVAPIMVKMLNSVLHWHESSRNDYVFPHLAGATNHHAMTMCFHILQPGPTHTHTAPGACFVSHCIKPEQILDLEAGSSLYFLSIVIAFNFTVSFHQAF